MSGRRKEGYGWSWRQLKNEKTAERIRLDRTGSCEQWQEEETGRRVAETSMRHQAVQRQAELAERREERQAEQRRIGPGKIKKAIVKIQEGVKLGEQREGNLREQKENDEGVENPIMEREERDRRIGEEAGPYFQFALGSRGDSEADKVQKAIRVLEERVDRLNHRVYLSWRMVERRRDRRLRRMDMRRTGGG